MCSNNGWLRVKREPSGVIVPLPEHLQVEWAGTKDGRDHFTALEGIERGSKFSVLIGNIRKEKPSYKPPEVLQFSLSRELLTYKGGTVKAITSWINPIKVGQHPIQIPDFPHALGEAYVNRSAYAKTWFYLGVGVAVSNREDRYLHAGRESAGCITVDPLGWTALYKHLILCRAGDGQTVGTVNVVR